MQTIEEFIEANNLTMKVERTISNPLMSDSRDAMSHWNCTIVNNAGKRSERTFTLVFSMGSAHKKPPTLADVLDCLASDASGYENAKTFEDWAGEYGYDTETFNAVRDQAAQLEKLLGRDQYEKLLWETERQ